MQEFQVVSKKICDMVDDDSNIILPAIQRKFVWEEEKICNLFNSIMNGYPIGTFLIWEISGNRINNDSSIYFYEFIKNWSEQDKKNNELLKNVSNDKKYIAILDGQQRLQSLLIGLRGTYATRKQNKPWNDINSFPKRVLCLNLKKIYDDENEKSKYEFKFIERSHIFEDKKNNWFEVGKIIGLKEYENIIKYINDNYTFENEKDKNDAVATLNKLNDCVNSKNLLGCYIIDTNRDLEEILDIFVTINSGATALSKPDLLFSTIIAKWPNARDEFDDFIKNINICNDQSKRFKFDVDFLIRTIMYMYDDIPVKLSIKNFTKLDINRLKSDWSKIKEAIILARNIILGFGFEDSSISSYNAIMPIIYYIYHGGSVKSKETINQIRKYFILAQLKNLYGVAGTSALTETRKCLIKNENFNLDLFKDAKLVGNRNYRLDSDEDVAYWFDTYKKGSKQSFMILSIIDPNFDGSKHIDEDHLYPDSILSKYGKYKKYKDNIANINLLQAIENRKEKSDMMLDEYIKQLKNKKVDCNTIIKYLPPLDSELKDYTLKYFKIFYKKRRQLIIDALKNVFE